MEYHRQPSNQQKKASLSLSFALRVVPLITWLFLSFLQYNFGRQFKIWIECVWTTRKKQLYCLLWFLIWLDSLLIIMESIPDLIFFSEKFLFCFDFFYSWYFHTLLFKHFTFTFFLLKFHNIATATTFKKRKNIKKYETSYFHKTKIVWFHHHRNIVRVYQQSTH